jgi:hypothetical protein
MTSPSGECLLPLSLPDARSERTTLFAVRRMAAHGVGDVGAAWLLIDFYSTGFRRPLVLLRAFMLELAHAACVPIRLAPCCTPRMTRDEGLIIEVLRFAAIDPAAAQDALAELTRGAQVSEPLSAAAVFARVAAEMALTRPGP